MPALALQILSCTVARRGQQVATAAWSSSAIHHARLSVYRERWLPKYPAIVGAAQHRTDRYAPASWGARRAQLPPCRQMAEKIDHASLVDNESGKPCSPPGQVLFERTCAENALDTLYRDEFQRLFCFFAKNVGRDAACDLAQEVFVRACASPAFAKADNPPGYLRRIAANLLIDHFRRGQTRGITWEYREDADGRCEAEQEHALLGQDLDWILTRALGDLPRRTREIFCLNRFEQKSYREISEELGISLSAVDYHMMKALFRLRSVLEEEC